MNLLEPLQTLHAAVIQRAEKSVKEYRVPNRWIDYSNDTSTVNVHPYQLWASAIDSILAAPPSPFDHAELSGGGWSRYAHIYNLFVRSATAFDHNGDGVLNRPNQDGLIETGTFMKSICLLPYIKALGCNTIHLLPITAIGQDGNKGDAGSPYAIRNPYRLDDNLAEPSLGLGVEAECAAFIAAAHHLGLRVVFEFVFRTASKDCDSVATNPEWFYWIDAAIKDRAPNSVDEACYGMPIFTPEESGEIRGKVEANDYANLLPPHKLYQDMFLPIPEPSNIELVDGAWQATYPDGRMGRIPGAFADWPVDDAQPPWGDVTYLRLFDHPEFNYVAYNTIRMYDERFAQRDHAVEPLWEYIANIIPHYQTQFAIDGAMIDMGHSLPTPLKQLIVANARQQDPNFAFWDENFEAKQISADEGYNAVMGSMPFYLPETHSLGWEIEKLTHANAPLPMFGAIENHNTPRAAGRTGGARYVRFASAIAAFLPSLPFIHNGAEFGEVVPINTGLGFSAEQIQQYPSDQLPLFSAIGFDWVNGDAELYGWWQQTLQLRLQYIDVITSGDRESIGRIPSDNPHIIGILRREPDWSTKLALLANSDMGQAQSTWLQLPTGRGQVMDHYTNTLIEVNDGWVHVELAPGACWWLEL